MCVGIVYVAYTMLFEPNIYVRGGVAGGTLILMISICCLALSVYVFFIADLIQERIYIDEAHLSIWRKFFRERLETIPISDIICVYMGFDMSYRYYLRSSTTKEFLTMIVVFKRKGKRIIKFLNLNSVKDYKSFVDTLRRMGIKVVEIPPDRIGQLTFAATMLQEEFEKCDRLEPS